MCEMGVGLGQRGDLIHDWETIPKIKFGVFFAVREELEEVLEL